jgi:hypothetical protein
MTEAILTVGPITIYAPTEDNAQYFLVGDLRQFDLDPANSFAADWVGYSFPTVVVDPETSAFTAYAPDLPTAIEVAGYVDDQFTPAEENAVVTVSFGGKSVSFELNGIGLQTYRDSDYRHLATYERGFIADEVEKALLEIT